MKKEYIESLELIGIIVSDPILSCNLHQNLTCKSCGHQWVATPKSKVQNFRKWKAGGCPICTDKNKYGEEKRRNIDKIQQKFEIITDLTSVKFHNNLKIEVKNRQCGHTFTTVIKNLLHRNVNCRVCNDVIKRQKCEVHNERKYQEALEIRDGFQLYKFHAYRLTKETYLTHKFEINPNNLPRILAGRGEGYHLDHIVSIYQCFKHDVPVELCAHKDNLRMLPWHDNISKNAKLTDVIPNILTEYFR